MGMLMGAGVWAGHAVFGGLVEDWIEKTGWAGKLLPHSSLRDFSSPWLINVSRTTVPAIVIPLALIMVNQHPQPVDDCPCFEDAIAFVSVVLGSLLSRWHAVHFGFDETFYKSVMLGSSGDTWRDMGLWWSVAAWKMVVGEI